MKKLLTMMLLMCAMTVCAQFATPVKFTVKENKVSDTELELVFTGTIDAGWHVYGTDIPDGGPTKAELTIEKKVGVQPKGGLKAKGKIHRAMDDMFGMELSYMEGTAKFVQTFTITAPEYEVAGYLTYGACNDENCIPPTDVEFAVKSPTPASPKGEELANGGKKAEELVHDGK